MTTLEKAVKIIVLNEGNYGSVNANDNGALSIGICQWHGSRAKALCKKIYDSNVEESKRILNVTLEKEIEDKQETWKTRKLDNLEKAIMHVYITSSYGIVCQSQQAYKDVQTYINIALKNDITDENSLIFLADICNQGGAGAERRIIKNTFDKFGKYATLDNFMETALKDSVFKNYKERRYKVYKTLLNSTYGVHSPFTHIVTKNETLSSIALRYDTTISKLVKDNNIDNPNKIYVGQKIKIIK